MLLTFTSTCVCEKTCAMAKSYNFPCIKIKGKGEFVICVPTLVGSLTLHHLPLDAPSQLPGKQPQKKSVGKSITLAT